MADRQALLLSTILTAGAGLKRYFGRLGLAHAQTKGQAVDLVSRADIETQERIVRALRRAFPQDGILAEEGDLSRYQDAHTQGGLWVIDPLDGTVNFLHGYPLFGVSIAYCRDGIPELGAIYAVAQDEVYWTARGQGARRARVTPRGLTQTRRLKVSAPRKLEDALMVTGFGYDRRERSAFYLGFYDRFLRKVHDVRRSGAACIDLAWLASGCFEGFWEFALKPWDVAAGALLVTEAGGKITHFNGKGYSIFRSLETLATNGHIHAEALGVIRRQLKIHA